MRTFNERNKFMRKKISSYFFFLAVLAIVGTVLILTAVFYRAFQKEVLQDLQSSAKVLQGTHVFDDPDNVTFDSRNKNLRITMISKDGTVIYDNEADVADMDNHGARPEVEEAFANGYGHDIRESATLKSSSYYYAVLMDNGYVLRVAKEASSIFDLYLTTLPLVISIALILMVLALFLTHFLTKSIIRPIEFLANNMDQMENYQTYNEMQPFIDTIQKQHDDLLKNANMRQEFTANVSHELKTPLTSISGYAELIESGMAGEDDIRRFAGEIHRASNRLLTLINDIIRLSEMDVAQEAPEMLLLDLNEVAEKVMASLQVNADKHAISLNYTGQPGWIRANRMMMEELIYNLTDNAIRYNSKNGHVWVSVMPKDGKILLTVKDDGIGIPKEHQERVFERFYRVDKSRSKQSGGTGLGLSIVKHIAMQHNALIHVESEPGVGTEIQVSFEKNVDSPQQKE